VLDRDENNRLILANTWLRDFFVPEPKFDVHFIQRCMNFIEYFWWGILEYILNLAKKFAILVLFLRNQDKCDWYWHLVAEMRRKNVHPLIAILQTR